MQGFVGRIITVEVVDGQSRCRAGLIEVVIVVDDGTSERVAVLVEVSVCDGDWVGEVCKDEAWASWMLPGRWFDGVYRDVCLGDVQWIVHAGRVELRFRVYRERCRWGDVWMSLMMFVHGFVVLPLCKGVVVPCLWNFVANVVDPFGGEESA